MYKDAKNVAKRPYRIQGVASRQAGIDFETNKSYRTFDEAAHSATVQACNAINIAKGNRFIVYKAIAVIGPTCPPVKTTMLDEYYEEDV